MRTLLGLLLALVLALPVSAGDRQYAKPAINLKTAATTTIFTTENGARRFYVTDVLLETTAATDFTVGATLSLGTNDADYNNISPAGVAVGMIDGVNALQRVLLETGFSSIPANTAVKVKITVGATATTATGKVIVRGFYE